jgi:hypothetical protein
MLKLGASYRNDERRLLAGNPYACINLEEIDKQATWTIFIFERWRSCISCELAMT